MRFVLEVIKYLIFVAGAIFIGLGIAFLISEYANAKEKTETIPYNVYKKIVHEYGEGKYEIKNGNVYFYPAVRKIYTSDSSTPSIIYPPPILPASIKE